MTTRHARPASRSRTHEVSEELLGRGREMAGMGRDIWLAGLGALAVVGEETSDLFDRLVESGEEVEKKGRRQLTARQKELADTLDERVYEPVLTGLRRLGVPTRGEMHDLAAKVDRLTHKVDALVTHVTGEAPEEDARRMMHVFKIVSGPEGWQVGREDGEPVGTWPTKDEALEKGRALAQNHPPSRLDVYRKDGTLQDTLTF